MTLVKMGILMYGAIAPGGIRDREGVPVGEVVQAYDEADTPSDDTNAAWIRLRLFSTRREVFVPITGATSIYRSGDDRVVQQIDGHVADLLEQRLAFPRSAIEQAPLCDNCQDATDGSPRRAAEAALYEHFFPSLDI